jgi:hypothetical protein
MLRDSLRHGDQNDLHTRYTLTQLLLGLCGEVLLLLLQQLYLLWCGLLLLLAPK